jgi:predicted nucleotidyltransferase
LDAKGYLSSGVCVLVMRNQTLAERSIELARIRAGDARFVIVDGSAAEGRDHKHSDYDVTVVSKRPLKPPGSVKLFYGMFGRRVATGWLVDDEAFKRRYLGDGSGQFVWRRRQIRKARLVFGDRRGFRRAIKTTLARRWSRKRQMSVIGGSYMSMVEYLGKMLNKVEAQEMDIPEFYQDGYIVGINAALIVAALNKIDLDSDRTMYRQILAEARIRPSGFARDFEIASGFSGRSRSGRAVFASSRRLARWARNQLLDTFRPESDDEPGFWQVVRDAKF